MNRDLSLAIELQAVDKEIARLTAEIAQLPRHLREIEAKLAGAQKQLESEKAGLTVNQQERKKLDNDIFPHQQKITKYKQQIFDVKTNEEYKALQHEIAFAEGEIRKIEDQILERMIATEEMDARIKRAEKELAAGKAAVDKEKAEVQARTRADESELARLTKQRDEFHRQMSREALDTYTRVSKYGKRLAVAEVRDGTCSECHVRLRPQAFQELKPNESLRLCESCYRILVYVPPPEPPEAAASVPLPATSSSRE